MPVKHFLYGCGLGWLIILNIHNADAALCSSNNKPTIKIHHPILMFSNKNTQDAQLFFEIVNQSPYPQTLIAAYSPFAKRTLLDQHSVGTHSFRLDSITVAPKVHYKFKSKGTTIRMQDFIKPIHHGDLIPVTLIFSDGHNIKLAARAKLDEAKVG